MNDLLHCDDYETCLRLLTSKNISIPLDRGAKCVTIDGRDIVILREGTKIKLYERIQHLSERDAEVYESGVDGNTIGHTQ